MLLRCHSLLLILLSFSSCQAQQDVSNTISEQSFYEQTKASRDGIGKLYLGREISHVMGHQGAGWLERPERDREENTSLAIQNLALKPTDHVADIGAGTGYYTFRMAQMVPEGKVYAVDIQPEMIALLRQKKREEGIENVQLIQGSTTDPKLPENSVDVVLFVDVYHELSHPREVLEKLVKAMKPNGRLILLEYRLEDPSVPIKRLHKMSVDQAKKEMYAVGLTLKENKDNLPWQHFMVFEKFGKNPGKK